MKFTDEQLSRILSAHENGALRKFENYIPGECNCLMEVATLMTFHNIPTDEIGVKSTWFEGDAPSMKEKYDPTWSTEQFLRELQKQGWA